MTGLKGASAATCQNSLATQRPSNGHIDRVWTPFSASFFIKSQNFHWIIRHSHHWAFFFPNILSLRVGLADIQDLSVLSWKTLWKSFESARGKLKYCEVKSQSWSKGGLELSLSILGLTCLPVLLTFIRCAVTQVWSWPRSVNGECHLQTLREGEWTKKTTTMHSHPGFCQKLSPCSSTIPC